MKHGGIKLLDMRGELGAGYNLLEESVGEVEEQEMGLEGKVELP